MTLRSIILLHEYHLESGKNTNLGTIMKSTPYYTSLRREE